MEGWILTIFWLRICRIIRVKYTNPVFSNRSSSDSDKAWNARLQGKTPMQVPSAWHNLTKVMTALSSSLAAKCLCFPDIVKYISTFMKALSSYYVCALSVVCTLAIKIHLFPSKIMITSYCFNLLSSQHLIYVHSLHLWWHNPSAFVSPPFQARYWDCHFHPLYSVLWRHKMAQDRFASLPFIPYFWNALQTTIFHFPLTRNKKA